MHKLELENFTPSRIKVWNRFNTDFQFPADLVSGRIGKTKFVKGVRSGLDTHNLHVLMDLEPGERLELNLEDAQPENIKPSNLPNDIVGFFGGLPQLNGNPMQYKGGEANGNAIHGEWFIRFGRLGYVKLFTRWYEDNPYLVHGEVIVGTSNPTVTDLTELIPSNLQVTFGDSIVFIPGHQFNSSVINTNEMFGDGQCWPLPIFFAWPRLIKDPVTDWANVHAIVNLQCGATAIKTLFKTGNPKYPTGFNARSWGQSKYKASIERLHTWNQPDIGPVKSSTDAGDQEDQVFTGGEQLLSGGVIASIVNYLASLQMGRRPCNHLELDGSICNAQNHPNAKYWDGRIHWHTAVSPDRLGKITILTKEEAKGWWGPDVEHWLINRLTAAARVTGSDACQWLLENHGNIYQFQWTHNGGSTSSPYAARAAMWEGLNVVHLWRNLKNRALAEKVKVNYLQRLNKVILPTQRTKPAGIWDFRLDSGFGSGWRWPAWQHMGCYGLYQASHEFGDQEGMFEAFRTAQSCLEHNWIKRSFENFYRGVVNVRYTHIGKPLTAPYEAVPISEYDAMQPWPNVDWYMATWDLPALAVVQAYDPNNPKLVEVLNQIRPGMSNFHWWPPELV